MNIAQCCDLHVARRHHRPLGVLVDVHELAQVRPALIRHARFDVELVSIPKSRGEPLHARRAEGIDRRSQADCPGVVQQQTEFRVVIGVVMGDEDVAQRSKRKLRLHELETDAVPGVDHVWYAVVDNEVGGRSWRVAAANRRTALRAEQHEPVRAKIGRTLLRECLAWADAGAG